VAEARTVVAQEAGAHLDRRVVDALLTLQETSPDPGEAALWQFDTAHRLLVSAAVK